VGDTEKRDVIRFSAPLLLLFAVPVVLLVLARLRRLPRDHAGWRRTAIQACMLLAAAAAALAVAGAELGARVDRIAVIFVLDRSRSVERAGQSGTASTVNDIREAIRHMDPDDSAGLVVFGAEAATEVVPSPSPPIGSSRASIPRDATDISAGLRRALADLPAEHTARIVLVSDGVENRGDALGAAATATSRGVIVDVVEVQRQPQPEVAVARVRVPPTADPGEPVELRVVTRATQAAEVRVRVSRDGATIAEGQTRIGAGDDVLVMRDVAPEAGVHRYDVLVEPVSARSDSSMENNEGGAFMRVSGGSKVLVLAGTPDAATGLADAIRRGGLEVELAGPSRVPPDLATLASYDLLVLDDLNARRFTEEQMLQVASYVRDLGGGLLMVGTRDSFGLGGYAYTPIEEALPATFDLRQRRDRASLAMIIAIDNSGSMGVEVSPGTTKLALANEAAARSAMLLSPFDRVGVIHVDTAVAWTLRMTPVRDPEAIAAAVRRAQPGGGGILVDITLREAYAALGDETTQLKHLLLFSDGEDSESLGGTRAMVGAALRNRITTSIVSMGNGVDTPELERLSQIGQGRFYIVDNMSELPRIFTQETIEASRSAIIEEAFRPSVGAPGAATRGIDFGSAPALGGYVVVNPRGRATRLLGAKDDDPLLLEWQHGVGRSSVFTTDAGSGFGRAWLAWPGYAALFGQLARDLARAPERRDARVSVTLRDGVGHVRVEAVDDAGRYRNYLDLAATVAGPGGQSADVPLSQTGAGRYEGTFDADAPGPYLVTVRESAQSLVGSAGLVRPSGDELRGEGTDHAKLAQIAALTGGRVRTDMESVFTDRPPPTRSYRPLWHVLLALAMCLMLVSVALRRLVLPRGMLGRLVPSPLRRWLRVRPARVVPSTDPAATLSALAAIKARTGRGGADVAPEVRAALGADPSSVEPEARPRAPGADAPPDADQPAPPAAPAAPSSLAEQLLERKKRKR